MSSDGSDTRWLEKLRNGDQAAAKQLWGRYFGGLVGLAIVKLRGRAGRADDAENVALSAIASFCHRAGKGQFPQLLDPEACGLCWRSSPSVRPPARCATSAASSGGSGKASEVESAGLDE